MSVPVPKDKYYHTKFLPYNNYWVQVETKGYGGYKPAPSLCNLKFYETSFIFKGFTDDSMYKKFENGYFICAPDGEYLITYKMEVNGKIQDRQESFNFIPNSEVPDEINNIRGSNFQNEPNPENESTMISKTEKTSKYYTKFLPIGKQSGTSYTVKIERKDENGDKDLLLHGYITNYYSRFDLDNISSDQYKDGFFYATPDGDHLITYKMEVEGRIEDRQETYKFMKYPEEVVEKSDEERALDSAVNRYVSHASNTEAKKIMLEHFNLWKTLDKEITVYRGQADPFVQEIRTGPNSFFSTSDMMGVAFAKPFFSFDDKCCLFILHVQPGVKYYFVRKTTSGFIEREYILEGNGRFYQDKEQTIPGFRELTMNDVKELIFGQTYFKNINNNYINSLNVNLNNRFKNLSNNERDRLSIDFDILKKKFKSFGPKTHTKNGKTVEQMSGIFEAYYFPPEDRVMGGKRKKTRKAKKSKKSKTRKH